MSEKSHRKGSFSDFMDRMLHRDHHKDHHHEDHHNDDHHDQDHDHDHSNHPKEDRDLNKVNDDIKKTEEMKDEGRKFPGFS
ncbi:hypothetical protein N7475_008397 [Penicillium sp. IBT 31633x]|nr:hypothetical protein N7475_008397 [Penicillium sp. IBT 31633x]